MLLQRCVAEGDARCKQEENVFEQEMHLQLYLSAEESP